MFGALVDAGLDLFTGSTCAGCDAPGRALCPTCRAGLPTGAHLAMPTPSPAGLLPVYAAGPYQGVVRALVLAHKERNRLALAKPLGLILASVVADIPDLTGTIHLQPVPSGRRVTRARGQDPLLRITRSAASVLRGAGVDARVVRLVRVRRRTADQAGLDRVERQQNLTGAFERSPHARALPGTVVLVDDVVTTGATLRAAQVALETGGIGGTGAVAAACVAATQRRTSDPSAARG